MIDKQEKFRPAAAKPDAIRSYRITNDLLGKLNEAHRRRSRAFPGTGALRLTSIEIQAPTERQATAMIRPPDMARQRGEKRPSSPALFF